MIEAEEIGNFNSLPHAEVDFVPSLTCFSGKFQLTTSRRGRLQTQLTTSENNIFQLTTSRRGRLLYAALSIKSSIFQLTTSRRGRRNRIMTVLFENVDFNSLPHAEVDNRKSCHRSHKRYFNSLPHAEVDVSFSQYHNFSFIFQLTTSRRGRHPYRNRDRRKRRYFNSLPHAEVDVPKAPETPKKNISTHYLTQR